MAQQSVGGATATETPGAMSATPGGTTQLDTNKGTGSAGASLEGERPAWLPEGFDTPEALVEAYNKTTKPAFDTPVELNPDGTPKVAAQEATPTVETPAAAQADTRTDEQIAATLKEAGGLFAHEGYLPAAIEFERTGTVTPETLAKTAEALGVPLEFAQTFMDSQKQLRDLSAGGAQAATDTATRDLVSVVGGEAEYTKFMEWAGSNLSATQQEAYNKALGAGDVVVAKALLEGFSGAYKASGQGPGPRDITGGAARQDAPQGVQGYASSAEMQRDMNDPKYATDPAFRRNVELKVGASKF